MTEDQELLAHYLACGRDLWNVSLDAAWLDYELRVFVMSCLPARRPLALCNVGIGLGRFDDWLGHVVEAQITSVDRDRGICRMFAIRQRREGHPHPARVVCGDVLGDALAGSQFDVITVFGSKFNDSHQPAHLRYALMRTLVPGGILLVADRMEPDDADTVRACGDLWLSCSTRATRV